MGKPKPARTIVVAGNCQASFLARALKESPELTERYRVIYFRNFRKGDQGELKAEDMSACAFFVNQVAHMTGNVPNTEFLPSECTMLRFPILWLNALWPTCAKDPRNKPEEGIPAGRYPYGDRVILDLMDQGLAPAEASARYLETDIAGMFDLDRLLDIDADKLRSLDQRAEIKFGEFVLNNFRRRRLFVTKNHISMEMMRHVVDVVFDAIGVPAPKSDLVEASGGMGDIHAPIHPRVAEHFGLTWYDPAYEYRHRDSSYPIGEYMRRYAAFE